MDAKQPRVVVVTGGGGAIGRAICLHLAHAGHGVVVADNAVERAERVAEQCRAAGGRALGVECDVRDPLEVEALFTAAANAYGAADGLVCGAAIFPNTPFLELEPAEWTAVLDTNLTGVFHCCSAFARHAISVGVGGRIVTISSSASAIARPGVAHYCASKAGVEQFTRALAVELAPWGIQANVVAPGIVESPFNDRITREHPDEHRAKLQRVPLGRLGRPDEIAAAVEFLLGPAASYVTGDVLRVDGGYTLGIARYAAG
jgi:3-oxoacyl-[acyl-carrier protein] reductase